MVLKEINHLWCTVRILTVVDICLAHLNVNKHAMVGFVEHFVAFGVQRELKWDLGLARWNLSCLGHLNVTAD